MSLHALATNMASKGRNGDSMLVHMTPGEVHGLQALAMKHGGSLTINPDTGLPEANFLKSLLPMLAGFALGPAGFGLVSSGLTAGAIVGGVTGLATGSLSKGLMAGLGAYGGFGIGESLAGLGAGELAQGQISANMPTLAEGATQTQIADYAKQVNDLRAVGLESASKLPIADRLSAGFSSATASPMDAFNFAKDNKMALGMAAAPIMADMMVPTTTKAAPVQSPGRIVEKRWNGREFVPVASTDAGVFNTSGRTFSDPYRGYNNGGIVALARGGVAHYEGGGGINEYDYAPPSGGGDYSVQEGGNFDYYANQFAPDVFAPVATAPVVDTPVATAPVVDYFANQFAPDVFAPVATPTATDSALAAYQAGDYTTASQLLANAGMNAQDVVNTYGLGQADAATVAQNLGYTGDMSGLQYATSPVVNTPAATAPVATAPVVSTPVTAPTGIETLTAAMPTVTTPTQQATGIQTLTTPVTTATTAATTAATTTPYYFQVNPDVAIEYARNNQGFSTPEAYAQAHYDKFGKKEGREFAPSAAASYAAANNQNLVTNTQKWIDENPFATKQQIEDVIKASGMSQGDVQRSLDALVAKGELSAAERYWILNTNTGLAGLAANNMQWLKEHPNATQAEIDKVIKAAGLDRDSALLPLTHGFQVAEDKNNIAAALNYLADPKNSDVQAWLKSDQGKAYLKDHPEFDAKDIAWTHYARYGIKEGRQWGAIPPVVPPVVKPPIVPPVVVPPINATQNTITGVGVPTDLYTAPAASLPVGVSGNTGPSQIGGGATVNPNGTITTSPRIPGIPVGGFTGSQNLRDTYTKGGGSLGYTSPTYTPEEFTKKYVNRMSGDSRAAYDYLTGKAGATYPVKSGVGQISEDYATAVLGYPARGNLPYIYNKATGKMDVNPDYVAPGRDSAGNVTYSMSLNDIKSSLKESPLSGQALYEWAMSNNLSAQQIADATGRSLSSVYADFRAGSKAAAKKKEDGNTTAGINTLVDAGGDGGGDGGGGGGGGGTGAGAGTGNAMAMGGVAGYALGGLGTLGGYSDGGRLLKGPGDGVSDSIPATIGRKQQPARLADGEFVIPARIVSELGNGSTDAGAKKLYAMMDRVQRARGKTTGKNKVAANSRADKYLPA
jgi:hypothetical protein